MSLFMAAVGGIAEMYMQHPKKEQVKLKDRKGFVRVAIEEGAGELRHEMSQHAWMMLAYHASCME